MKLLLPLALLSFSAANAADLSGQVPPVANRSIDFLTDIQPIFESRCFECHGPEKQKGGYRLDLAEIALHGGDEHAANIIPGKSAQSPLIHFVAGLEPDNKMPPKGDPLSLEQIGLLRAWIDQGAQWPKGAVAQKSDPLDWWSLRPLQRPALPAGSVPSSNPIDAFIRAKLTEKGLRPSPEADPRTLIRRISIDLVGLLPTPEESDAFVLEAKMDVQSAVEKLTDRLLASPRYGERWARHWLDVVHYGDTHGYDKDKPRPNAWPYRDYVIRSFNADKPYARFIQEQLAGDALFPGTQDGWAGPGFIAAGPWDYIGHAEVPESKVDGKIARVLDRDDMVSTTMNAFCAVTVQCARCHTHKFDPIKQEDYYRLQAVFSALDRTDKTFDVDPDVAQMRQRLEAQRQRLEEQQKALELKRTAQEDERLRLLEKRIAELKQGTGAVERPEFGYHSKIETVPETTKWVQIDLGTAQTLTQVTYTGCHDTFNGIGAGFGFPRRYKVELSDDPQFQTGVRLLEDRTLEDSTNPGVQTQRIDVQGKRGRYIRFTATKLAPRKGDFIFALAEVQAFDSDGHNLALGAKVTSLDSMEAAPRWSRKNLVDGYFYTSKTEPDFAQIALLEKERDGLRTKDAKDPEGTSAKIEQVDRELVATQVALRKLPAPQVAYVGAVHTGKGSFVGTGASGGKPRTIHVLKRGDVRMPMAEVGPGTLPFVPEMESTFSNEPDEPESMRRVALAQWVSDSRNPLTWRTIVNRVWQYHFGHGISDSPSDFGRMGQLPTHPELLDWLASEFRDGGQSLKKLHRLIITSATYRQSSEGDAENQKLDGNNTLLWRMNRRKLEAEAVRDNVLLVAGKLNLEMGGPGYQDFIIDKPNHSPHYEYEHHNVEDPKSHRRSVYRFIVRSQPQPLMTVLDCADPSMSVDKRNETVNALQALSMRNNRLTISMARHFAARLESLAYDPDSQLNAAYGLAFNRRPSELEKSELLPFVKSYGLSSLCRLIFNLNEFSFID